METAKTLHWHKDAVLIGPDGAQVGFATAQAATAKPASDPTDPTQALPEFFAGIKSGHPPLIGTANAPEVTASADDFLTLTGGTTGTPKIIRRASSSWLHSIRVMQEVLNITPAAKVATLGDLSHSLALYASVEALVCGAQCHVLGGSAPHSSAREIHRRGISHLYATPTQLRLLSGAAILSVMHVVIGGGVLDTNTNNHLKALFPSAKIRRFYGAAETSFVTLADETFPLTSVGAPFPGVQIDIRDTRGTSLPPGSEGLIWVKSPMLFAGYVSGDSKHTMRKGDWLCVGELGNLDHSGNLTVKGRVERVVNVADQLVYLDQVETLLRTHNSVNFAAVLAQPDDLRGTVLLAVFDTSETELASIRSHINSTLPPPCRPRELYTIDNWPMLPSGKTDYKELERRIRSLTA
ncbi:MAG: long-chain fatty acid--CoA ligase [Rhodobacteraceae bacterium]|nr:long-chain fatty acid--CoA ligase [Paracoccaceae bacterium]